MSKHTPGPWAANAASPAHRANVFGDEGHQSICFDVASDEDAHLIAAAPEMLTFIEKFLRKLLYAPDHQVVMKFDDLALLEKEAKKILDKARGSK